jgi:curli production assembly/transport component CsgG
MRRLALLAASAALALGLGACAYAPKPAVMTKLPVYPNRTASETMLGELPAPEHPVAVAVYGFGDETGQFKPSSTGQTLSRAISQGGGAMLIRSLEAADNRGWFTIVEREQLKDLLNERQIIRDQRAQYLGEKSVNPQALPALLFAGVLLEGGVVGYDTNTVTGGVGATMLGIGGDAKYQQDTVTVYLRAVSVKTGEVLTSVTASKTITSYAVDANIFRYIASTSLLETENGFTTNEPAMLALQQAIDKAVYGLVMQGAEQHLWSFADPKAAWPALWRYEQERDGRLSASEVAAAESRLHRPLSGQGPVSADRPPPEPTSGPPQDAAPSAQLNRAPEGGHAASATDPATDHEDHIGDLLAAADSSPGLGPGDRVAGLPPRPSQ